MSKLFFGGVPTRPDVEKLLRAFTLQPGDRVSYEQIAEVIEVDVGKPRFRTITNVWRNRLFRDHLLQTKAEGGMFVVLTAEQALDARKGDVFRIGRHVGRVHVRALAINSEALSDERKDELRLLSRETKALLDAAQSGAKAIAAPSAVRTSSVRLAAKG